MAGRCVAGDKVSHAATRQMMCCTVTGQGAGVAAAVSVKEGLTPRQVDISKVQTALRASGSSSVPRLVGTGVDWNRCR